MKKLITFSLFLFATISFSQCPWSITVPSATVDFGCSGLTYIPNINIGITGSTSDLRYLITSYPMMASFSPSHAMVTSTNPAQSGVSTNTIVVTEYGTYVYLVTNTVTGCQQSGTITTVPFDSFGVQGFAPTTSVSCNGSVVITPGVPVNCALSATLNATDVTGNISGNTVTNLCYGGLFVVATYTASGPKNGCRVGPGVIYINSATAIRELSFDEGPVIYPNPSTSHFFIENKDMKINKVNIFNVEGKLEQTIIPINSDDIKAGLLTPGIYFIEVQTDSFVYRKKLSVIAD